MREKVLRSLSFWATGNGWSVDGEEGGIQKLLVAVVSILQCHGHVSYSSLAQAAA